MTDLTKALNIQGWMHLNDMGWLVDQAANCDTIVEVGVWKGRSLRAMCDNIKPGGHAYGVDHWEGSPNELETHHKEAATEKGRQQLFAEVQANLGDLVEAGTLTLLKMPSLEGAAYLAPILKERGGADFIFIDACHVYEAVRDDIAAWLPLVRPGGLLAGHDRKFSGVRKALEERLEGWTPARRVCWAYQVP